MGKLPEEMSDREKLIAVLELCMSDRDFEEMVEYEEIIDGVGLAGVTIKVNSTLMAMKILGNDNDHL